ncbi:excisionase [Clostridium botulinum]|uniref:excisionase n=1 Tax=Clostridium botulinum TaxID=1491 RepID=UPI003DA383C5
MELTKESLKEIFKESIIEILAKEEKATITIDECASYTGIGRNKILELAHSKKSDFPCFRVGARFLINKPRLDEWLKKISEEKIVL